MIVIIKNDGFSYILYYIEDIWDELDSVDWWKYVLVVIIIKLLR